MHYKNASTPVLLLVDQNRFKMLLQAFVNIPISFGTRLVVVHVEVF